MRRRLLREESHFYFIGRVRHKTIKSATRPKARHSYDQSQQFGAKNNFSNIYITLGFRNMSVQTFTDLYHRTVEGRPNLAVFLSGHLAIEYLLRKLITIYDPALGRVSDELSHAKLIALNADLGTITSKQREVLTRINKIRNKFAHEILYEPTVDERPVICST
jgi:hypothetical protein